MYLYAELELGCVDVMLMQYAQAMTWTGPLGDGQFVNVELYGLDDATLRNAIFKLTLYWCVVSVCCVDFAMNFMIVTGMLVCNSFLISVCMFIVSKALQI